MSTLEEFRFIALSLPGLPDPAVARAASRAGEIGILNAEFAPSADAFRAALAALRDCSREHCGVRVDLNDQAVAPLALNDLPPHVGWVILASDEHRLISESVRDLRGRGLRVLVEALGLEQARLAESAGADGVIAKGNESGGWVGEETSLVLFQRLRRAINIPVWIQGGIGGHTAASAFVGGAAGIVLDAQLALLRESPLPDEVRHRVATMDGSETVCLGEELRMPFRAIAPPRSESVAELQVEASRLAARHDDSKTERISWRADIRSRVGWTSFSLWPIGQDACLARHMADRYGAVGRALRGLRDELLSHLRSVKRTDILAEGSALAAAHGTAYPIAQGPMTRVSDTPVFAEEVAAAGALPFIALGMLHAAEIEPLLVETRRRLDNRPWGVGLLGFLDAPLREEQLSMVRPHRPPFALIAGGHPEHARALEAEGIRTYLHAPTPGLLAMFLEEGAIRLVLEGRECGGHVGPLSSFVLWEQAARMLPEALKASRLTDCHVLLAGGIHDARSAAMAAACMAPLAERGVKVGVLLGTAYLFTREAISSGAILEGFQRQALTCSHTVLLETAPGHVVRCAPTPYTKTFNNLKARLLAEGASLEHVRRELEAMNIGRLRLAAKGVARRHDATRKLKTADENEQLAEGLYMLGQTAGLRGEVCTVKELHHDVSAGGTEILRESARILDERAKRPPAGREGIAIVGMSCLLPGARDLDEFWTNIINKVNSIREVPSERWNWKLYFDERRETADRIYARWGGFLDPVVFDPAQYGMPPGSLASIEPVQLLALETARAALRDAGYEDRPFKRETTSVIIGVSGGLAELGQSYVIRSALAVRPDHSRLAGFNRQLPEWTEDSFAGILLNVIAGRIANRFDLGGPSFAVDAACASSLAAVYLACRELETGASDMVLVGGVDTFQTPFNYLCFCKTHALSPRGICRTFDQDADGTCISEGLSMMALKRLSDAELDGDRIYAVIRGVGASSDGRARGLTAPSPEGQARALHRAYEAAGFSPATIGLVEAHGTGTVAGDRAEIESLRRVFEEAGSAQQSVALGSVKSMIGHTKGAAGVTGLLKVSLALHRKVLPATLNVEKPNESLAGGALYANAETRPWIHSPRDVPRRAAVSAFGFGGANYHVVAEEYDGPAPRAVTAQWPCELFIWREQCASSILSSVTNLLAALKAGAQPKLKDLSFTLWRKAQEGAEGSVVLAMVASSIADLIAKLETARNKLAADEPSAIWDPAGVYFTPRPLARGSGAAFLFPGQGSQYPDMLRELAVHFSEVREAFETADRVLDGRFDRPLSSFVFPPPRFTEDEERAARKALTATNIAQPALGAAALGLANLMRALEVEPAMAAGHSYGEYAALCVAGCLTPEQLFDLSESRGRFIMEAAHGDLGAMAALEADEQKTRTLVGDVPDLWIANMNSPRQTIISGTKAALAEALKRLEQQGIGAQPIQVACAFHSPLVAPARDRLKEYLNNLCFKPPRLPVFANSTGAEYPANADVIRAQLGEHLVSPVRFIGEIEAMYAAGARIFVEVGPRSVLTGLTEQILGKCEHIAVPVETRKRSGLEGLLHALAQLAAHGVPVNLNRLFEGREPEAYALDRLVEETGAPALPATAWWINGGRAMPVLKPASPIVEPKAEPNHLEERPTKEMTMNAPVPSGSAFQNHTSRPDVAETLRTHEQVMQQLLETHRRVMLAAMGKFEAASASARPAASSEILAPSDSNAGSAPRLPHEDRPDLPDQRDTILDADRIRQEVLKIVGERTGYPPEMLDLNADMEADLGIDSIKRVEIAGRLRKAFPHIGATAESSKVGNLANLRTLNALIERIASIPAMTKNGAESRDASGEPASAQTSALLQTACPCRNAQTESVGENACHSSALNTDTGKAVYVPRFIPRMVEILSPSIKPCAIRNDGVFLITDDEGGLADAVAEIVIGLGGRAVIVSAREHWQGATTRYQADFSNPGNLKLLVAAVRKAEGRVAGIVHLLPLRDKPADAMTSFEVWRHTLQEDVKSLFFLAQAAAEDLKVPSPAGRARIMAAVDSCAEFPGYGGIAGLISTLATEWPDLVGRVLALDTAEAIPSLAETIRDQIQDDSPVRFVSFHKGQRRIFRIEPAPFAANAAEELHIEPDWVILLTGGACGITAQVAMEFAERFRPTLIITGRSPLPPEEESPLTRGIEDPAELRRLLARQLGDDDRKPAPADIEKAYRRLCREREIRATLASIRSLGARAKYIQADVRDAELFGNTIDRIYAEFGRLDGVIHGAGLIEDRRVEDKTPESFDRVFDTKADGAFVIAQRVRLDSVKFLVFFSSVACLGNAGQSDYAAANGVLNALARNLDRRTRGRVVSVLWGPWQSAGMASEEVQRRFQNRGVQLIPPAAGRRCLVEELLYGRKGEAEIIFGNAPYETAVDTPTCGDSCLPLIGGPDAVSRNNGLLQAECVLDPLRHTYLRDHILDGKPVFPAAMAMELMAEAAWAVGPAGSGIQIDSLHIQKGIIFNDDNPITLRVSIRRVASSATSPGATVFAMQILTQEAANRAHYRADVTLGIPTEAQHMDLSEFAGLEPFPLSVSQAYEQYLFHGPCLAGLTQIEGIRRDAIAGTLKSVPPMLCLPAPSNSRWILDPTVLDSSLQLVILWERHWHDMTPLPVQIARFRLFHPLCGLTVRCLVKVISENKEDSINADIYYSDTQGRVLAILEGLQCVCAKALNRLSNAVRRKTAVDRGEERPVETTR